MLSSQNCSLLQMALKADFWGWGHFILKKNFLNTVKFYFFYTKEKTTLKKFLINLATCTHF